MTKSQQEIAAWILVGALSLYVAPILIACVALPFVEISGRDDFLGFILIDLISGSGPVSLVPALFIPLIAGLSVSLLWSGRFRRWTHIAVVIALVGILAAGGLHYLLMNADRANALWRATDNLAGDAVFQSAKSGFVLKVVQDLGTFLAILLGLRALPGTADDPT